MAVILGLATAFYVVVSLHWRIMVDSAVMHYVVFLMQHGRAPYVQISDNNLPGAYFVEAAGMKLFGSSDVGWRFFEFAVLALLSVALIDIARRWDRFAGIFAAGVFVVLHSAEGPQYAAERELTLTMLLLAGVAILFRAVDRGRPALLVWFGLATGLAASIKPTCLLLVILLLCLALARREVPGALRWQGMVYAIAGAGVVFALDLLFLTHFHAVGAFVFILRQVVPAYVGLGAPRSLGTLVMGSFPRLLLPAALLLPVLLVLNRRRAEHRDWHWTALWLGAGFGLFSFLLQRKGYLHHRYTLEVFLLLLLGIELFQAIPLSRLSRVLAIAGLAYVLFLFVPRTLRSAARATPNTDLESAMQQDLSALGRARSLQNQVQCFDLVYGCLDALYHLQLTENGSFTGDLLFFPKHDNLATAYYRDRFWAGLRTGGSPEVVVLTNQNLEALNSFDKLARWPEFQTWLEQNYDPVLQRSFTYEHFGGRFEQPVRPEEQDAYRIYVRRGSPLLPEGRRLRTARYPGES